MSSQARYTTGGRDRQVVAHRETTHPFLVFPPWPVRLLRSITLSILESSLGTPKGRPYFMPYIGLVYFSAPHMVYLTAVLVELWSVAVHRWSAVLCGPWYVTNKIILTDSGATLQWTQLETKQHNVITYVYLEVTPFNKQAVDSALTEK
jgi:hypothetical protein